MLESLNTIHFDGLGTVHILYNACILLHALNTLKFFQCHGFNSLFLWKMLNESTNWRSQSSLSQIRPLSPTKRMTSFFNWNECFNTHPCGYVPSLLGFLILEEGAKGIAMYYDFDTWTKQGTDPLVFPTHWFFALFLGKHPQENAFSNCSFVWNSLFILWTHIRGR